MDSHELTDEELILRVVQGQQDALETLYDRYARVLYSLALRMLGSRQAAEEVVQEVLLRVWQGASSFEPERGSFSRWILSICHHRAVDDLRRGARTQGWTPLEPGTDIRGDDQDLADGLWKRHSIQEALETLPGEQRQVIIMAYFHGMTQSDIAHSLGLPVGTVKTRTRAALQKLKDKLKAQGVAESGV